ncbi:MAG TPA: RND transporter [Pirellulales bacterium]|nr:RND transporter [Pirellulales bacterium]
MLTRSFVTIGALVIVAVGQAGCNQSPPAAVPAKNAADSKQSHEGWWCDEHGVPEDVCALCDKKVAARFKADGDWCKEHDRPESQCFACHPELEAKFAAQYEAKYGHEPPKPEGEHDGREHDQHPHS